MKINLRNIVLLLLMTGAALYLINDVEKEPIPLQTECIDSYTFSDKKNHVYVFTSSTDIKLSMFGNSRNIHTVMSGLLNVKFFQKKDNNTTIALMQLSELLLKLGNPALEKTLKHIYTRPFITVFTPEGRMTESFFQGNDSDFIGLKQFIELFQIILKNQTKYVLNESVYEGNVTGVYRREGNKRCLVFKKRKGIFNSKSKTHTIHILSSDINASIDKDWLTSFHLSETMEVYSGKQQVSFIRSNISMEKNNQMIDKDLEIWQYHDNIDQLLVKYKTDNANSYLKKEAQKAKKKWINQNNITLGSLLLGLKGNDPLQMAKIVDFLTLYPDQLKKMFAVIKNSEEDLAAYLINILQSCGIPQAQAVLRDIAASEEFSSLNKLRAVIAMGGLQHPTRETIDFLWDIYDKREDKEQKRFSDIALLSIGRAGPKSDNKEEIQHRLKEVYIESSDDSIKQRVVLLSMQNAGAKNFELEIFDALNSTRNNVKSAAIEALSFQNSDEVRGELLPLFKTDEVLKVRRKTIKTLLTIDTDDNLIQQARKNLFEDDDATVRKGIILYLLKYRSSYPENIEILRNFRKVEHDKNNQILLIKNGF